MAQSHTNFTLSAALLLALCSTKTFGAEYMVQIGAYKNTGNSASYSDASTVGRLNYLPGDSWQKVLIGKFATRQIAESARSELIGMGYSGAFLVNYNSVKASLADSEYTDGAYSDTSRDISNDSSGDSELTSPTDYAPAAVTRSASNDFSILDELTSDEKELAVYLDGQLRIKHGEQFMTLEEYRQTR